jgi:transcriptional regulator with XRE-family HTH domain
MPATNKAVSNTPRRVDIPGTIDLIDLSTMGGRITWARIRKELRQEDVADRLGKSRATVVQYEKNNIMPPIPEVQRLADTLDVSPEFLAFGRQGVDAMRNGKADTVVTLSQMTMGGKRLFESGEVALPRAFFRDKDINVERTKMFVLDHDEGEFDFYKGDNLIVDLSAKDITDTSRDLFLVQIDGVGSPVVFKRDSLTHTGKAKLVDGKGKAHMYVIDDLKVIGAVNGALALISA